MEEFAEFILMIGMAVAACVVLVQMASSVTAIVLGVKTASKDKSSAFLGYSLILLAASQMISILSSVPANMIKARLMTENTVRMFNYLSIATNMTALALDIVFAIFFCLHFIKNYKVGKIHLIVMLIAEAISLGAFLSSNIATGYYFTGKVSFALYVAVRFLAIIIDAVPLIAVINLCLKTDERKRRRKLFIFPLLTFICSASVNLITIFLYSRAGAGSGAGEFLLLVFPMIPAVILFIESIYIYKTRTVSDRSEL